MTSLALDVAVGACLRARLALSFGFGLAAGLRLMDEDLALGFGFGLAAGLRFGLRAR